MDASRTDPSSSLLSQGFFSGSYNAIAGKIKGPKGDVGEISGHWNELMELHRKGVRPPPLTPPRLVSPFES